MQRLFGLIGLLLLCVLSPVARADADVEAFSRSVKLDALRAMSVQHNQTIKTFDTYARETLFTITAKSKLDDRPAYFAVLDMAFRPEQYFNRNLIYIRNKPFRVDLGQIPSLKDRPQEAERILKEGTVSLAFWLDPHVQADLRKLMGAATVKANAIGEIQGQAMLLAQLLGFPSGRGALYRVAMLPPLDAPDANARPWVAPSEWANELMSRISAQSETPATQSMSLGGYPESVTLGVMRDINALEQAWIAHDVAAAQSAAESLAETVKSANPAIYPSVAKRKFEIAYNSLYRLTFPAGALYFVGFVMFLLAWKTELKWIYVSAVVATIVGLVVHTAGIAIRWWLVEKSVGNWFEAIPIKNQFESVLMSAFFGVTVALVLERWKRFGIFGAAAAFIGMMSLVLIQAAPYVTGKDIGGEIRQNAGILMTYWLYIHVTLVTASYALIGMTFVMGVWYVIQYVVNREAGVLKTLDDCNLIMLQLAFWILGIGIITGALWADVSWGRPWGWDPKETFALITWIVYLIIIHVRFITAGQRRALMTSVLSIVGFGVMLFNWIGVNFFLVGLHSYA